MSNYSTRLRLVKQTFNENVDSWGQVLNDGLTDLLDAAVAGRAAVVMGTDANYTLSTANGAADEARQAILHVTSSVSLTATRDIIIPGQSKVYIVYNATTGGQNIVVKTSSGVGVAIPPGKAILLFCDGTDTFVPNGWRVIAVADATSITPNGDTTDELTQVNTQAGGTLTINAPSGTPSNGQRLLFRIKCTNVQTLSFNAIYRGSTDVPLPTATSGASKTDYMGFIYNSADSKWDLLASVQGF